MDDGSLSAPLDSQSPEVTALLDAWSAGDRAAVHDLMPLVIDDLRALARGYMARETPGHTLAPTALVNEAYMRLAGRRKVQLENRVHFFSVLAQTMRQVLVDHARKRNAARRGSGERPVEFEEAFGLPIRNDLDLVALDDALSDLARLDPRQAEIVQLSYFAGLTYEEIAGNLELSVSTVRRDLKTAKMWLLRELRRDQK